MFKSKPLFIVIAVCIIMIVIFIIGIRNSPKSQVNLSGFFTATPTPIPLSFTPKTYTDTVNNYSFQYPDTWKTMEKANNQDQIETLLFNQSGTDYSFQYIPGGNSGKQGYAENVDRIDQRTVDIGNRQFLESTWKYKEKPFFISVIPNEPTIPSVTYQMSLPPEKTQQYIDLFNQIISHIRLSPDLQNRPVPFVTLQSPRAIHAN